MQEWLRELSEHHRFKIVGGLLGLVLALMILHYGLPRTLFIGALAGLGYWLGKKLDDEPEGLAEMLDRLLPPGARPHR